MPYNNPIAFSDLFGESSSFASGLPAVKPGDLKGIKAFAGDYKPVKAIVVCNEKQPSLSDGLHLIPWQAFLERL